MALLVHLALSWLFTPLPALNPAFPFHSHVQNAAADTLAAKLGGAALGGGETFVDAEGNQLASVSGGRGKGVNRKGQ